MTGRGALPLEALVGRDSDAERLLALLSTCRLVTLTAIGGTGKTRLAREVADRAAETGRRVVFVDLTAVTDPATVPARVLSMLAPDDVPGPDAVAQVAALLVRQPLLLVLDNFEQVLPAADVLVGWLRGAPGVHGLVTSRVPLGVASERQVVVQPLATPMGRDVASVMASPAGDLFLRRARRHDGVDELTDEDAAAVADICTRLGGIPLALELAAARVHLFGLRETAARLEDVTTASRSILEVVRWSASALTPADEERIHLLATVVGPFDGPLIEQLWRAPDPWPTLERLVDLSLVMPRTDQAGWFELLVPVREAVAHLADPETAAVAHLRVHAHLLHAAAALGSQPVAAQGRVYDRLLAFRDLIDSDLAWHLAERPEDAAELVWELRHLWDRGGLARDGLRWADKLLADPRLSGVPRARVLTVAAGCRLELDGPSLSVELGRQAAEEAGQAMAPEDEVDLQLILARGLNLSGRDAEADAHYARLLELLPTIGEPMLEARVLGNLAIHRAATANTAESRARLHDAATAAAAVGDAFSEGMVLGNLAWFEEDPQVAVSLARRAWTLLSGFGSSSYAAWAGVTYAASAIRAGDHVSARALLVTALGDIRRHGGWEEEGMATDAVAWLLATEGRDLDAARLQGAAQRIRDEAGFGRVSESGFDMLAVADGVRRRIGEPTWRRLADEGARLSADELGAALANALTTRPPAAIEGRYGRLSPRERQVLHLVAQGASDGEIAESLEMSKKTASVHVSNIKLKLGVETRIDVALAGRRLLVAEER